MNSENFGLTADNESIQRFTLSGGGLCAKFINWGAVLQDLRFEGESNSLVLGLENLEDYLLENDPRTICCELPLWLENQENRSFVDYKDIFKTSQEYINSKDIHLTSLLICVLGFYLLKQYQPLELIVG